MKTKSPRRPLTGAALASATKQIEAEAEKHKLASILVDNIKRFVASGERVELVHLQFENQPADPLVLQIALRDTANALLRAHDRDAETLAAEKSFRVKLATEHSAQIAEATETINALKTTLRALLK